MRTSLDSYAQLVLAFLLNFKYIGHLTCFGELAKRTEISSLPAGSNCSKTCTVADLELRHVRAEEHMNSGTGGRKLNQFPMYISVWVFNHCPCMVDNVVIYAPDGFPTIFPNGTDERIFSKVGEHLYLINEAGPLEPSVSCPPLPPSPSPIGASAKNEMPAAGPLEASVKDDICPSTSFWYTWYDQIELKPVFLVPHC